MLELTRKEGLTLWYMMRQR